MSIPSELFTGVMDLEPTDRAELAYQLLLSLECGESVREPGYEEAWATEIEERMRRYEVGETRAVPAQDVIERLRSRRQKGSGS